MKTRYFYSKYYLSAIVTIFLVSFGIFGTVVYTGIKSDIAFHAMMVIDVTKGKMGTPVNFLYYLTIYSVAFFQARLSWLLASATIVLSLAVMAKFILTYHFFMASYENNLIIKLDDKSRQLLAKLVLAFSVFLIFTFSLPTTIFKSGGTWYIGQIPPNVWHNSTTIFLMPFAFALFWISYENLVVITQKKNNLIALLCIVNILIKPSFFFVFVLVYPLMLMLKLGITRQFLRHIWPVVIGVLVLIVQYLLIYWGQIGFYYGQPKTSIIIAPFSVWSFLSNNIFLSILVSTLYPITYLIFYGRDLFNNLLLKYTVLLYLTALVIMSVLSESGSRALHANFFWQSFIINYFLFVVISKLFIKRLLTLTKYRMSDILILIAFLLHVMAGFAYLAHWLIVTGSYL